MEEDSNRQNLNVYYNNLNYKP